jgi:sugar phosphate isomerase/epimerase
MKLGVFTPVFGNLSFEAMIAKVRALEKVQAVELGTGGWPGHDHLDLDALVDDQTRAREYRSRIEDAGLIISALSCHGNPIHPDRAVAREYDEVFRKTVRLAEQLAVEVVVTFSGCPGDSDEAKHPNWVTNPWPPEFLEVLDWQWEKKVVPYWCGAARVAADHGVKVALEAHPGFVVYNVDTALKLRSAVGPTVGVNFNPSHFFWQGVDVPTAISTLGDAVFHVHAKDVARRQRCRGRRHRRHTGAWEAVVTLRTSAGHDGSSGASSMPLQLAGYASDEHQHRRLRQSTKG